VFNAYLHNLHCKNVKMLYSPVLPANLLLVSDQVKK